MLNYAIPGIYPPFLLSKGSNFTKAMKITGIQADEFLRQVLKDQREITIPHKFITKSEEGHYFYHMNSISKTKYIIVQNGNDLSIRGRGKRTESDNGLEGDGDNVDQEGDGDDQGGVNNLIRGREDEKAQDRKEDNGDGRGHDGARDDNVDGKEEDGGRPRRGGDDGDHGRESQAGAVDEEEDGDSGGRQRKKGNEEGGEDDDGDHRDHERRKHDGEEVDDVHDEDEEADRDGVGRKRRDGEGGGGDDDGDDEYDEDDSNSESELEEDHDNNYYTNAERKVLNKYR